ncbi:MAG TPA: dethiobiotin synthase [Desulfurivibrio alkaliphilus]|uniref:ATP-dependent dethiobiotin synthetase BioD n=1 Tax=Desulfurivibrio alkaliphilus TaxID=427923 RepID=A0A7C2TID9_9BACT|nr:dethiobiotin synthase [Desulfurivibrio alkaliphilus]
MKQVEQGQTGGAIFVAATDTGVGKTMISALVVDFLRRRGVAAAYQKWVATGCSGPVPADLAAVAACSGQPPALAGAGGSVADGPFAARALQLAVPYRFRLPASPHLAAEQEGGRVEPERLRTLFRQARAGCELLVVEGVGGLLVPLNRQKLLVDLVAELALPVLLVARSGLGTINHTLLSLEALRSRKLPLVGVVFSDEAEELPAVIVEDNLRTIAELGWVPVLGRLPRCRGLAAARRAFIPIGEKLLPAVAAQ